MMWNLLAPFVGGAFSLLGGKMGSDSNAKAARLNAIWQAQQNAQNIQFQNETNAASRRMAWNMMKFQSKKAGQILKKTIDQANIDRQLQKDFAQQGVKWRVDDAKAAGIHPLAALGAQLQASSPIAISGSAPSGSVPNQTAPQISPTAPFVGEVGLGNGLAAMGQDVSRAITATATQNERDDQYAIASRKLSLENQALQNKLLAVQIARTRGAGVGPAFPGGRRLIIDGQGNAPSLSRSAGSAAVPPGVKVNSSETTTTVPGAPAVEPGTPPELQYYRTSSGGYSPEMSKQTKEATEDSIFSEIPWFVRNRVLPSIGIGQQPPPNVPLKPGFQWFFDRFRQEYKQIPIRSHNFNPYQPPGSSVPHPDRAM